MSISQFEQYVWEQTGITLSESKRAHVEHGITQRLQSLGLKSPIDYVRYIQTHVEERAKWLELVTTNETYFFREEQHYDFIRTVLANSRRASGLRIWSAACSVGAEAYTAAMLLSELDIPHEVVGSDINPESVKQARNGLYPIRWLEKIPQSMVKRYCLKGIEEYEGLFLVNPSMAGNVLFQEKNLLRHHPDMGTFDVIFLRNVLLYFDKQTKVRVLNNVLKNLKIGGHLFTSRTELISNLGMTNLKQVDNSIYQLVE